MSEKLPLTIRKTTARLAAIQAIYADAVRANDRSSASLVIDLIALYTDNILNDEISYYNENSKLGQPDHKFLDKLIKQNLESKMEIDQVISEYLNEENSFDKLSHLLKSILRSGVCELKYFVEIPPKVIINEYTNIASSFLSQSETGFINGILDKISADIRKEA